MYNYIKYRLKKDFYFYKCISGVETCLIRIFHTDTITYIRWTEIDVDIYIFKIIK